jgi:hypothetical protein
MTTTSVSKRPVVGRVVVALAAGLLLATLAAVLLAHRGGMKAPAEPVATNTRLSSAVDKSPFGEGSPAEAFAPGSYLERATYASPTGTQHMFTARRKLQPTWPCVGLEHAKGIAFSCAATLLPDGGLMHVSRTIIGDERYLSGLVVPAIASVSFVEDSGRTTTVEVRNQTFLFRGTGGHGLLEARGVGGTVLLKKRIAFSN